MDVFASTEYESGNRHEGTRGPLPQLLLLLPAAHHEGERIMTYYCIYHTALLHAYSSTVHYRSIIYQ